MNLFWGPEIEHLKAHNFVWKGCCFFLPALSRNFDDRLISNLHRFVILCICWENTKCEYWSLAFTNSSVFNHYHRRLLKEITGCFGISSHKNLNPFQFIMSTSCNQRSSTLASPYIRNTNKIRPTVWGRLWLKWEIVRNKKTKFDRQCEVDCD